MGGGITIPNSDLTNSSITIAGHTVSLGGTQALAASDLSNGTTGTGDVVLATSPTIASPTISSPTLTGTVAGAGTIPNAVLVNDSVTIAGHPVALGGTQALAASDLTNGTTGSGDIVLASSPAISSPTISSPTFTGTASGLTLTAVWEQATYASAATIATSDAGKAIILSGSGLYAVTLGTASGYASNAVFLLVNTSTTRGKQITVTGGTNFILWPGQSVFVQNVNNTWIYETKRWRPNTNPTFYIDNVNGSDSSDGLDSSGSGAGCFQTVQHAMLICEEYLDILNLNAATIQLPTSTGANPINETVSVAGTLAFGQFDLNIQGNPSTPSDCHWFLASGGSQPCVSIADFACLTFNGISFGVTSGSVPALIECRQLCIADFENCVFNNNTSGVALKVLDNGRMNLLGNITIDGIFAAFIQIIYDGSIDASGNNFIIEGTPNVGIFVQIIGSGCMAMPSATFSGNTSTIGGQVYNLNGPCCLVTEGTVSFPSGFSAGATSNGGVVV